LVTDKQKSDISVLLQTGIGHDTIARITGLPADQVEDCCKELAYASVSGIVFCKACGAPVAQTPKKRRKIFCSEECRRKWWKEHPEQSRALHPRICAYCGKEYKASRSKSMYCSHECYMKARSEGKHKPPEALQRQTGSKQQATAETAAPASAESIRSQDFLSDEMIDHIAIFSKSDIRIVLRNGSVLRIGGFRNGC
jgi:hypothetical protein